MKKLYYGWFVLLGLFILMMVSIGITVNSFSFFYKPVISSQGFSYGEFSITSSIAALCAMFGCVLVAKLLQKIDLRAIVTVSAIIYAGSIFLDGFANTLTQFYIISAFTGLGYAGLGGVAVSQVVSNWFKEKQGLAMAIAMAGSGVGGFIFSPTINALILAHGWRATFMIIAGIVALITLPVSIFIIRLTPEEKGLKAYGEVNSSAINELTETEGEEGLSLKQASKTAKFWVLCVTNLIAGLLLMGVQVHAPIFMQTVGLTSTLAASVTAASSIILIPGKLLHGFIHDRFGSRVSAVYIFGAFILTLIVLSILNDTLTAYIYGVLFGLSGAITTVALPLWAVSEFGKKDYAMIFSIMSMFMTFGAAVGSPTAGFIYDKTGSYRGAWLLLIGVASIGLVITVLTVGKKKEAAQSAAA